jgi:hypothetical protein
MIGWPALDNFLQTDPGDVGCDEAMRVLHVYVELTSSGAADEVRERYAGVAAHLRACGPCGADYDGLLHAINTAPH